MIQTTLSALQAAVCTWEGVSAIPHRFGGVEFTMNNVEVGHMHDNGLVDIPFTRKIREALVATGAAELHHILPETGWISYYLHRNGTLEEAIALMRLSYLHKRRRRAPGELANEIDHLPFADSVKQAALGIAVDDTDEVEQPL